MALFAVEQAVILDGVRRAAPRCPPQRRREITADEARRGHQGEPFRAREAIFPRRGHQEPPFRAREAIFFAAGTREGHSVPARARSGGGKPEAAVESQKRRWEARSSGGGRRPCSARCCRSGNRVHCRSSHRLPRHCHRPS